VLKVLNHLLEHGEDEELRRTIQRHGGQIKALHCDGGRYWDRTSGPCRVKRWYGVYESTICERRSQLQQALGITRCHLISRNITI
jgi:hypothetical protein